MKKFFERIASAFAWPDLDPPPTSHPRVIDVVAAPLNAAEAPFGATAIFDAGHRVIAYVYGDLDLARDRAEAFCRAINAEADAERAEENRQLAMAQWGSPL